ncbi:hypothetical protein [Thermohalobacter berrensis]|uniref:CRISPR-associated protein Cas6 C-terminal domain-containing protein n=1 Tax=Thermohalobacter berrensis TaxID=99594 RepID=A0A419T1E0_9FIRM|nr:hypothetical protein [Thermohalobacter berrensis]RKD31287.1 hypothetical protein BET03_03930 [Thermohalobacter berrensis]
MKIKRFEVILEFKDKIKFIEDPELAFYKMIFRRLKNIVCITPTTECSRCSYLKKCVYYYLSGNNFFDIETIPVVIKKPLISKKIYNSGEKLNLKYIFLGKSTAHMDFFSFIIKEFETRGIFRERYRFFIRRLKYDNIEQINGEGIKGFNIITPIDYRKNIFKEEFNKISRLNEQHKITNNTIEYKDYKYESFLRDFQFKNNIYLVGNKIKYRGRVGRIYFENKIVIDNFLNLLKIVGLGSLYSLGGGNFEFIGNNVT